MALDQCPKPPSLIELASQPQSLHDAMGMRFVYSLDKPSPTHCAETKPRRVIRLDPIPLYIFAPPPASPYR